MLKVEAYKIFHSLNLLFLTIVVIPVAFFLGVTALQMDVRTGDSLMSVIFVSSSAVLMLYIAILASMFINRDYASNNFRVMIGIGIGRNKIVLAKYFIFLAVGTIIISLHALSALIIPCIVNGIRFGDNQVIAMFVYMTVYASIISTMFLLAVIGRTIIKSILLNIAFIILSSVSVVLLGSIPNFSLASPIQSLQIIANNSDGQYIPIVLISLLYMVVTHAFAHLIFMKQEL